MTRIALFDWSVGGHRPIYVRRFVEALRPFTDLLLAFPQETLDAIGELGVDTLSLGAERAPFSSWAARRSILAEEVERLRHVSSLADQAVHLHADHVLFHLAATGPLPRPVSLIIFLPRAHYAAAYGTRLPPGDRVVALAKDWGVRRWRRRPDAHAVFTLDEEAARRWGDRRGAPAHWLPEPPVATLPGEQLQSDRSGFVLYGHLASRKGIDRLARALTIERTNARVVLAGTAEPDYLSELQRHAAAMEAAEVDVELRAWHHSELDGLRLLASARCALLPYPRHPGMSRVLLEACSVGTPVVTDSFGLVGHLVRRHGLGLAVDSADPRALREAMLSVAERSDSYSESLARFAARFTPERFRTALLAGLRIGAPTRPRVDA